MRTVMVAPGATPCGTRTRTKRPSGALTVIDPPGGMLGGIFTRMSVEPGCRGGGRGGCGGAGAPPAPRRIRLLVPVRTFVWTIWARSTRQGPPGRCDKTTVRSPEALA